MQPVRFSAGARRILPRRLKLALQPFGVLKAKKGRSRATFQLWSKFRRHSNTLESNSSTMTSWAASAFGWQRRKESDDVKPLENTLLDILECLGAHGGLASRAHRHGMQLSRGQAACRRDPLHCHGSKSAIRLTRCIRRARPADGRLELNGRVSGVIVTVARQFEDKTRTNRLEHAQRSIFNERGVPFSATSINAMLGSKPLRPNSYG